MWSCSLVLHSLYQTLLKKKHEDHNAIKEINYIIILCVAVKIYQFLSNESPCKFYFNFHIHILLDE